MLAKRHEDQSHIASDILSVTSFQDHTQLSSATAKKNPYRARATRAESGGRIQPGRSSFSRIHWIPTTAEAEAKAKGNRCWGERDRGSLHGHRARTRARRSSPHTSPRCRTIAGTITMAAVPSLRAAVVRASSEPPLPPLLCTTLATNLHWSTGPSWRRSRTLKWAIGALR
jgi:hypothetical protein